MKYLTPLLLLNISLLAKESYTIKPTGDIQLRYDYREKEFSQLGEKVYKEKKISYDDYTIGGSFGVKTLWEEYSLNTILHGVGRIHKEDKNILKNETTYYNNNQNGFLYLGEFNLEKKYQNHEISIGRQSYDTPLVGKNHRITQNSYEGIRYNYKNNNIDFKSLWFHKTSASTMSNNVPYNHPYGFLGYGLGYNIGKYRSVSEHIINKDLSTNGAIDFIVKYGDEKKYISYQNLFVDDFFNTSYLTLGYNIKDIFIKAGMIHQFSVGDDLVEKHIENSQLNKKLKSNHYNLELKYKKDNLTIAYSISKTQSDKNSIYKGTLLSPFSNKPSWLVGLNTSHATIADTVSQKISITSITKLDKMPLVLSTGFIRYDIGKENGLTKDPIETSEWYLHTQAYFSKNLSLKIQYSYVKNFDPLTSKSTNTKLALEYKF